MCFAPQGDSDTSRRTFDALATGCVPVVVKPIGGKPIETLLANLPFTRTLNWRALAHFQEGPLQARRAGGRRAGPGPVHAKDRQRRDLVARRPAPVVPPRRELANGDDPGAAAALSGVRSTATTDAASNDVILLPLWHLCPADAAMARNALQAPLRDM